MSNCTCLPFQDGGPCPSCAAASREQGWREIAVYLADCIAASAAQSLDVKRTGKNERRRQLSMCDTALKSIEAGRLPSNHMSSREERVRERLTRILAEHKGCGREAA